MTIKEYFEKHKIHFIPALSNDLDIACPFCKATDINGFLIPSLQVNQNSGRGNCQTCNISKEFLEIIEELELGDDIEEFNDGIIKLIEKSQTKKKYYSSKNTQDAGIEIELEEVDRIKKFEKPEKETTIEGWRSIIKSNFPELLFPAEIGLSIISQLLIQDITNPFALVLVDVPSSGKTITINFFSEIDGLTYATDKFTPASFISNATNVKKHELPKIDLLPRLRYKMFLIRDLSVIFSKPEESLNECLGILTRVLDGEGLNTDSGAHGQRYYVGEYLFMILAGSTPVPPRVWKMMGNLGSRLFFLNMGAKEKSETELANQVTTLAYKEKEKICRLTTKNFINTLWYKSQKGIDWDKTRDKQEYKVIVARCARLLARLRGVINVWKDRTRESEAYDYTNPVIEMPDRINQLFYNICRGHAVIHGRTQINKEDLKLIVELAIDSSPTTRAKLFRKLLENNGVMKTSDVESALKCSKPTALKEMEALKILDVCYITENSYGEVGEPEKEIHLTEDFKWFLSEECKTIRNILP